jgi:hypothetical protein
MRQRYNEAPKKPNFIFQVTDLQQEKIIIEKSGENREDAIVPVVTEQKTIG